MPNFPRLKKWFFDNDLLLDVVVGIAVSVAAVFVAIVIYCAVIVASVAINGRLVV